MTEQNEWIFIPPETPPVLVNDKPVLPEVPITDTHPTDGEMLEVEIDDEGMFGPYAFLFDQVEIPEGVVRQLGRREHLISIMSEIVSGSQDIDADMELLRTARQKAREAQSEWQDELGPVEYGAEDSPVDIIIENKDSLITHLCLGPSEDVDREHLTLWDQRAFEEFEFSHINNLMFNTYVNPSRTEQATRLHMNLRGVSFSRSMQDLLLLPELQQMIATQDHYTLGDAEPTVYQLDSGGIGVHYEISDKNDIRIQMTDKAITFRIDSKEYEGGDDATEEERRIWLNLCVREALQVTEECMPLFMSRVFNILEPNSKKAFVLVPTIRSMDEDEEIETMYMDPALSDAMKGMGLSADIKQHVEKTQIPDVLTNEKDRELFLRMVRSNPEHTFDMVAGYEEQIRIIKRAANKIKHQQHIARGGVVPRPTLLLLGEGGVGKNMFAEACTNYLDGILMYVTSADFEGPYVGESQKGAQRIFDVASKIATEERPVVLYLNEVDKMLASSESGRVDDHDNKTLGQFLNAMEVKYPNMLIIGSGNFAEQVDPILTRPGRFNKIIKIPSPDVSQLESIFQIRLAYHMAQSNGLTSEDIDTGELAALTKQLGLNGSGIKEAIEEAIATGQMEIAEEVGDEETERVMCLTQERLRAELLDVAADRRAEKGVGFNQPLSKR